MKLRIKYTYFIIAIIILVFSKGSIAKAHTEDERLIKQSVNAFFQRYFEAYEVLDNNNAVNMSRSSEDMYLFQKAQQIEIAFQKEFDLAYKNISYRIKYKKLQVGKFDALVETMIDIDFQYKKSPGIKSAIYNTSYVFKLIKEDGLWKIVDTKSDYEKFRFYFQDVNDKMLKAYQEGYRGGIDKRQAIDRTYNDYLSNIYRNKARRSELMESIAAKQSDSGVGGGININTSEDFRYSTGKGSNYAVKYATAPVEERLFYTVESDCTNFVSQCIWAAYGGYLDGNELQTKANINKKYKMTRNWFGNSGGGTPPWEAVEKLYLYILNSTKSRGPKALDYNVNALAAKVNPLDIKVGDVLQFRRGAVGRYTHSVYVTSNNNTTGFDGVFVCQHSTDWKNRSLEDLILSPGWGGLDDCFMRGLTFPQ